MEKITVTIITKNEAHNIERCLKSLVWADEIIIADSCSTDGTVDICKDYGCLVFSPEWEGFGKTKQLCVDRASNNWILSIDADEVVSLPLKKKILSLPHDGNVTGYHIKRNSFYLGRLIKYSGWQGDYPLRLFRKENSRFTDDIVHEKVVTSGKAKRVETCLFHYTYPDITTHVRKMNRYSSLGAEKLFQSGKRSGFFKPISHSGFRFFRMYIVNKGFLDCKEGFLLACLTSFEVFLKYYKLWELQKLKKTGSDDF